MDQDALAAWARRLCSAAEDAWNRGDRDAYFGLFADELSYRSHRILGARNAEGREAVEQIWALNDLMPEVRLGHRLLVAPDKGVLRSAFTDGGGNEVVSLAAVRYMRGLVAELVVFDETAETEAREVVDHW